MIAEAERMLHKLAQGGADEENVKQADAWAFIGTAI
jgi:hypothetical protein